MCLTMKKITITKVYVIQVISSVFKDLARPKGLRDVFVLI